MGSFNTTISWTPTILAVRRCGKHPLMEWGERGAIPLLKRAAIIDLSVDVHNIIIVGNWWGYSLYLNTRPVVCLVFGPKWTSYKQAKKFCFKECSSAFVAVKHVTKKVHKCVYVSTSNWVLPTVLKNYPKSCVLYGRLLCMERGGGGPGF